ncbi:hypothetical protein C8N40_109112 [Pontibacter mucosus]|uniref:Uncharacterized protein n=1 Tax=Pontibacter mucosus TaxID=1649266 RepID=A0A2T5YE72_9BACT|nr:hypothetical protein [Pontibacter mucosus]PTX15014.1 hypothetical protein C8N40_109112 [Pontibacter mucosus]
MTQDQFYYCLGRILELREKIKETYDVRRRAQAIESAQAEEQVDFDSLSRFADNKEQADKNTAASQALLKELAAQEAKIRAFVPLPLYGTRIEAALPDQPPLYVLVETDQIAIEKGS